MRSSVSTRYFAIPGQTGLFQKVYDSGDSRYPNDPGRQAMGEAVDLALLQCRCRLKSDSHEVIT